MISQTKKNNFVKIETAKFKLLTLPVTKNNAMCIVNDGVGIPTAVNNTSAAVAFVTDLK